MTIGDAPAWRRDYHSDFDLEDPEFNDHYEEIVSELARSCPIAHGSGYGGYVVVNDYESVRQWSHDTEALSSETGGVLLDPVEDRNRLVPTEWDPPRLLEIRKVINPYFAPRYIQRHEHNARQTCRDLINKFIERGHCDMVEELAAPLPGLIFFREVFGMPDDDIPALKKLANDSVFGPREGRAAAHHELAARMGSYLEARRASGPRGDVVDAIMTAEIDGQPMSEQDRLSCVMTLALAGLNTTTYVLGRSLQHFAEHPEDVLQALENDAALDLVVEELLRLYTPVFVVVRRATRDLEIHGAEVKAGQMVLLGSGVACRDPERVPDPDAFHPEASMQGTPAFGFGPHRCVGSHLARFEVKLALQEVLGALKDLRLAGTPAYTTGILRDITALPMSFAAAPCLPPVRVAGTSPTP